MSIPADILPTWAKAAIVLLLIAFGIFFVGSITHGARKLAEQETAKAEARRGYMVDCVPKLTEKRCDELWRWQVRGGL